jgi:hypothetical protein
MQSQNIFTNLLAVILLLLTAILFFNLLVRAIDTSIDNQNIMLCKSAKVSGNEKYLKLCQQYYRTGDVIYMREQPL